MLGRTLQIAAICLVATAAVAQERPMIAEVDVDVELSDMDANALDYWPDIGHDLAAAILAAADPMLAEGGYLVDVQVAEISLAGATKLLESGEFNHLEGWVYIRDEEGAPPVKSEQIVLDASTFTPGGNSDFFIIPGRPDFYNALVNVFALRTVEEVAELGS